MAVPNFIAKSTAQPDQCLRTGSTLVVEQYAVMRDRIIALKGRPVAALFAEPVVSRKSGALELAWYSDHPGTPTPLSALDPAARAVVAQRLRGLLTALAPLLGDAMIGPLVARALYIQAADSAFALGQEPVLINWAVLPPEIAHGDQGALDRHFAATLGSYAPFGPPRLVQSRPGAAPQAPAVRLLDPAPLRRSGGVEARGLLIATGFAAGVTLLINLPGILAYPAPSTVPGNGATLEAQRAITKAMQDKIAAAAAALKSATCNQDGTLKTDLPGGKAELPPKQIPARPQPGRPAGDMSRVADVATQSVVLVLAFPKDKAAPPPQAPKPGSAEGPTAGKPDAPQPEEKKSVSVGSGFFIGPRLIVTNEHVVGDAESVFITNHFLGKLQKVTVKYRTHKDKLFEPDFAVLEAESDNSPPPVALSTTAARLMNVVSAGFPGVVDEWDPQYQKLFKGDLTAAPEVTTFPGFVTLIQDGDGALPRIVHSATIGHGNSGGPLLDLCGRALGVNTLKNTRDADIGYVVSNALATKGLLTFLDQNHVTYLRADDACPPIDASMPPAPGSKPPDSDAGKPNPGPGTGAAPVPADQK